MDIGSNNVDALINQCWDLVKNKVEVGSQPVSSEKTLVFLFAMELIHKVGKNLIIDFENQCYGDISGESTYLDLLFYTDRSFQVAIEFKFPTGTPDQKDTRKKIYRDIGRLNYLKAEAGMNACYFLMATNVVAFLNPGKYRNYPEMGVAHDHAINSQNNIEVDGIPLWGVEVKFKWDNIKEKANKNKEIRKFALDGRYAWLMPVKVYRSSSLIINAQLMAP